jgi:hypothetical protein
MAFILAKASRIHLVQPASFMAIPIWIIFGFVVESAGVVVAGTIFHEDFLRLLAT